MKTCDTEVMSFFSYTTLTKCQWDGTAWVVHGHKHNNDIRNYQFINGKRKTINVNAELINYKPLDIDFLVSLNIDSIKRMDTIRSKPVS